MCHQLITVLFDSVDNNIIHKFGNVMEIYKKYGQSQDDDFYLELNAEEADELLKQSTHLMCGRNTADN